MGTFDEDTYCESDDEDCAAVVIATAVCHDTWLPRILIGVPIQESDSSTAHIDTSTVDDDLDPEGCAVAFVTPEEAYEIGAAIITQASHAASLRRILINKSLAERKEIIELEAQFSGACDPE